LRAAASGAYYILTGFPTLATERQRSSLRHFFSAYFHEDWQCDADSTEAVVAEYARDATRDDIRLLSEALLDYSKEFVSDKELEGKLFTELGCYYLSGGKGLSAKFWLQGIRNHLLKESHS
jgi:hypothetical protein